MPLFETLDSMEEIQDAIADPEHFFARVIEAGGALGKKLALGKARPVLEPQLNRECLSWEDALPAFDMLDSMEEVHKLLADPEDFFYRILSDGGPVARKIAVGKARWVLEPKLKRIGIAWTDSLPLFETLSSMGEVHEAIAHPEEFFTRLMKTGGSAAKKLALGKARPEIELITARHSLSWEDVAPLYEAVDTVDELEKAIGDPENFLVQAVMPASTDREDTVSNGVFFVLKPKATHATQGSSGVHV